MTRRCITLLGLAILVVAAPGPSQVSGELQIEAKPIPGQLDALQATAFQLGGTPPDRGPKPASYRWEILEGEGGTLLEADKAEAIFQAPTLEEKSMELFVIQLTATYSGKEPATAQLHVRVHKELPAKTAAQEEAEDEIVQRYRTMSRRERKKMAKRYKKQRRSRTTVVQAHK
jgi:hypothetical protein